MWTPTTREQHSRRAARYQTDLTDKEWRLIEPHLPAAKRTGRPRSWSMREIVNAIFYVLRGGIAWRLLPSDFPPWPTVYRWFSAFRDGSVFEKINHALVMADRERVGRDASPSAAIIDSQSVKTTEAGGPRGYDAGKKINGRKRHALVDTDGRALLVEPHPANIQDRDGGGPLLQVSRPLFPFIKHVWADGGYNHERVTEATNILVEIVRKQPDQVGFVVLPRRWVVERFFAWINRNRRLAKDFEDDQFRSGIPLRRFRHAAHPPIGALLMSFETDSNTIRFSCRVALPWPAPRHFYRLRFDIDYRHKSESQVRKVVRNALHGAPGRGIPSPLRLHIADRSWPRFVAQDGD